MGLSRRALALGGVLLGGLIHVCHADEWDVVNFHARASYDYDSNVFRENDDETPTGGYSDHIKAGGAGLDIDQPYGQQRFRLNGFATRYKYNKHDFLDHTTKNYLGAWDWSLTPRFTGTLAMEQKQNLASAANFENTTDRNLRTIRDKRLQADWWMHSNWHLRAEVGQDESHYEVEEGIEDDRSYKRLRWGGGVRYDAGNDRHLTAMVFKRDAEYDTRVVDPTRFRDDGFEENEYEVSLNYPFGGDSRLSAKLSYLEREYPHVDHRDFSGWTGGLRLDWGLTGKLVLHASYRHDLLPWQNADASYADVDILSAGATWRYTLKQRLDLRVERKDRDHRGALPGASATLRKDVSHAAILTWTWAPNLTTEVNANILYERRNSNDNEFDYDAHGFGVSVNQMF